MGRGICRVECLVRPGQPCTLTWACMNHCAACGEEHGNSCRLTGGSLRPATDCSPFEVQRDIPLDWRIRDRGESYYPLLCAACCVLAAQPRGYWKCGMLWQLECTRFRTTSLYRDAARQILNPRGRTIPLLSIAIDLREDIAAKVDCESLQILLHELAHRCGAVLPEWKLWFGNRYPQDEIYGRRVNSADAISMAMLERVCPHCRWPD